MASYEQTIQELVQATARVLDQASQDISRVAERAYYAHDSFVAAGNPETDHRLAGLAQLSLQLEKLVERQARLSRYVTGGLGAPPEDEDAWPRIRIIQSQEEERSRLARELEEGVGQLLANAVFELASCRYLLDAQNPTVDDGLVALQTELEQGLSNLRQLIADLDPPALLGNFGLVAGLRRYLERFETRTGLQVDMDVRAITERLPATVEVAIFRIIQEALENVRRHSQASRVKLDIYEEDGFLVFCVTDDGIGLQPERVGSRGRSLGLVSMHDRAELLQGKLRMRSDVRQGTQVILSIPYPIS